MMVLTVFFLICGGVCYLVAKQRKANAGFWVVMGAMIGPLAIPFVFFARPQSQAGSPS